MNAPKITPQSLNYHTGAPECFLAVRALLDWTIPTPVASAPEDFPSSVGNFSEATSEVRKIGRRVLFCDLFDTLIYRDIAPASRITRKTANFLSWKLLRDGINLPAIEISEVRNLVIARLQQHSHEHGENGEYELQLALAATIDRLLPDASDSYRCSLAAAAFNYEIGQEFLHCHPIDGAREFLSELARDHVLICVTDSYFDRPFITRLLTQHGFAPSFDAVYISSEAKANKRSGGLFEKICAERDLAPDEIIHIGDDPVADYLSPRSKELAAVLLRHRALGLQQAELAMRLDLAERLGEMCYLQEFQPDDETADAAEKLGSQCIGPAIALFALNVIELDRQHHYDHIYFVSRDGHLPFLAYREIVSRLDMEDRQSLLTKSEYVHLSRLSTLCPKTEEGFEQAFFYSTLVAGQSAVLGVFASLGLDTSKYENLLLAAGFSEADLNSASLEVKARLLAHIRHSPDLKNTIYGDLQGKRQRLEIYLRSHGFFSGKKVLLVDVGWRYRIAANVREALGDLPDFPEIHCALLGYTHELEETGIRCHPGFLYDAQRPDPLGKLILDSRNIIETLSSSTEGSCIGYSADGQATPILAPPDSDSGRIRQRVQHGAVQVFRRFADVYNSYHLGSEFRLAALVNLLAPIVDASHALHPVVIALGVPRDAWFSARTNGPLDSSAHGAAFEAKTFISQVAPRISISFGSMQSILPASKDMERLLAFVQKAQQSDKQLVLWGYGLLGKLIYPHLERRITHLIDADPTMQGKIVGTHTIGSPEMLTAADIENHLVLFTPLGRQLPTQLETSAYNVLSAASWFSGSQ